MESTSIKRLRRELLIWKSTRPFGFYARLTRKENGIFNYFKWEYGIPGPKNTPWEGGLYKLYLEFPPDYPVLPPKCIFEKKLFHPNIYPSGLVCLSIMKMKIGELI